MKSKMQTTKKLPNGLPSILDPTKPFTLHTDVQAIWKKYGWVPPQEQKRKLNQFKE